jgi:protein-tyrosine phosphatase
MKEKYPDLDLYLGAEILYHQRIADSISRGVCRTLNGTRFVLIEFLPDDDGDYIVQSVEAVAARGYTPILAHAERYRSFLSCPGYALSLAEQDIPIQLNVRSVTGGNGKKVKKFCHLLLKAGAAAVIASDAHDPEFADAKLGEGFRYVSKKFGEEYARALFCDTPRTLLGLDAEN